MAEATSRSMKMLLQRMPVKGFLLTFVSFTILFFICVIVGATGPQVYDYDYVDAWNCPNKAMTVWNPQTCLGVNLNDPGSYLVIETAADRLNLQVTLVMGIANLHPDTYIAPSATVQVDVKGRNSQSDLWTALSVNKPKNRTFICSQGNNFCYNQTIAEVQGVDFSYYQFVIYMNTTSTSGGLAWSGNTLFWVQLTHNNYTLFELWFRFVFLIITFIALCLFTWKLRRFAWPYWTFEQKWTLVLLFGVLFYDNPFYPLEILVSGWFPLFLNRVLYGSFLMMLLLYWLVTLDGIRTEPQHVTFRSFYLPKLILIVATWLSLIVVYVWTSLHSQDDPAYSAVDEIPGFIFFEVLLLVFLVIYIFWIVYIVCRGCADKKVIPSLGARLYFFAIFTLIILAIAVAGVIFGFLEPDQNNAAQFLTYLGLFNLYIYVNAFLYLPAGVSGDPSYSTKFPEPDQTEVVRLEEEEAQPRNEDHN